jgi:hypothetical protein
VLLGLQLPFSISREFTPGFRDFFNLLTMRIDPGNASKRVALGGLPSVFFHLLHNAKVKHSNPVLVEWLGDAMPAALGARYGSRSSVARLPTGSGEALAAALSLTPADPVVTEPSQAAATVRQWLLTRHF